MHHCAKDLKCFAVVWMAAEVQQKCYLKSAVAPKNPLEMAQLADLQCAIELDRALKKTRDDLKIPKGAHCWRPGSIEEKDMDLSDFSNGAVRGAVPLRGPKTKEECLDYCATNRAKCSDFRLDALHEKCECKAVVWHNSKRRCFPKLAVAPIMQHQALQFASVDCLRGRLSRYGIPGLSNTGQHDILSANVNCALMKDPDLNRRLQELLNGGSSLSGNIVPNSVTSNPAGNGANGGDTFFGVIKVLTKYADFVLDDLKQGNISPCTQPFIFDLSFLPGHQVYFDLNANL